LPFNASGYSSVASFLPPDALIARLFFKTNDNVSTDKRKPLKTRLTAVLTYV